MTHCVTYVLAVVAVIMAFLRTVEPSNYGNETCPGIYSCANCTAFRLCNPNPFGSGFIEYKTVNCSRDTPYCDATTGTCVATPSNECAESGEIVCLRDGTFPYPTDCSKYFTCKDLQSFSVKCIGSYYYYNSDTEKCLYNKGCYTFSCNGRNGFKIAYPNDPSIYAYCINNVASLVNQCYGKDELNLTSQQCEPVCRYDGLIPDTLNCTKYYRCSKTLVKGQYQMTGLKCPSGQAFSEDEYQCLPIQQVPSCSNYNTSSLATLTKPVQLLKMAVE